jgi:hypothetical protein
LTQGEECYGIAPMVSKNRRSYALSLSGVFWQECYRAWRGELLASALVVASSYLIARRLYDPAASSNIKIVAEAVAGKLFVFAVWHLIRTPYILHRQTVATLQMEHTKSLDIERFRVREQTLETRICFSDWEKLAEQFPVGCRFLRADFQRTSETGKPPLTTWRVAGGNTALCNALASKAGGAMLLKSPKESLHKFYFCSLID